MRKTAGNAGRGIATCQACLHVWVVTTAKRPLLGKCMQQTLSCSKSTFPSTNTWTSEQPVNSAFSTPSLSQKNKENSILSLCLTSWPLFRRRQHTFGCASRINVAWLRGYRIASSPLLTRATSNPLPNQAAFTLSKTSSHSISQRQKRSCALSMNGLPLDLLSPLTSSPPPPPSSLRDGGHLFSEAVT